MNILDNIASLFATKQLAMAGQRPGNIDDFWYGPAGDSRGTNVTADTAMRSTAVWACVKVISETFGTLPLMSYKILDDGGRERIRDNVTGILFGNGYVNTVYYQTQFEFNEMMLAHLLLRGNFYAEKVYKAPFIVSELVPIHPDRVTEEMVKVPGGMAMRYRVSNTGRGDTYMTRNQIFHVRGLSLDGMTGVSALKYAKETIEMDLSQRTYGAAFFRNDAKPGMYITFPETISDHRDPEDNSLKNLRDSINKWHKGPLNAGRVAVLEHGGEIKTVEINHEDAQFLESRQFSIADIARLFRVQPHLIGDMSGATFSNIEQQSLEFVMYTLSPWAKRIESNVNVQIVTSRDTNYVEFNMNSLLRGDQKSRFEAYGSARNDGWLSRNEIRKKENLNPVEGGDDYLTPANMNTLGQEPEGGQQSSTGSNSMALTSLAKAAAERISRKERAAIETAGKKSETYSDYKVWLEGFMSSHVEFAEKITGKTVNLAEYCKRQNGFAANLYQADEYALNEYEQDSKETVYKLLMGAA